MLNKQYTQLIKNIKTEEENIDANEQREDCT